MKSFYVRLFRTFLLSQLALCVSSADQGEYLITDHGARGDNGHDNAPLINALIAKFGPEGGTILIPAGEFRINSSIVVNKNNVTIRGVNYGLRSNIDPPPGGVFGPAGGSKIILGAGVEHGIAIYDGGPQIQGLTIKDLAFQASDGGVYQIGIFIDRSNRFTVISNVNCINLRKGVYIKDADQAVVENSWLAECEAPLHMHRGVDCIVADNALGGQPGGVTADFHGHTRLTFTGNNLFPDGWANLFLSDSHHCNISHNTFTAWYTGILQIEGNSNLLSHNQISAVPTHDGRWPPDPRGRDGMYGIVRILGNDNVLESSTIFSWQPEGDVRVHNAAGDRNVFRNLYIGGVGSGRKIFVNGGLTTWTRITRSGHPHEIDLSGSPTARVHYDP